MANVLDYAGPIGARGWNRAGEVIGWASVVLLLPVASLVGVRAMWVLPEWGVAVYFGLLALRFALAAGLLWRWKWGAGEVGWRGVWRWKVGVEAANLALGVGLVAEYMLWTAGIPFNTTWAVAAVMGDAVVGMGFAVLVWAGRGRSHAR